MFQLIFNRKLQSVFTVGLISFLCHTSGNTQDNPSEKQDDKINLALRRTADALLRQSGDSTSRIPGIEKEADHIWRVILHEDFKYEQLPALLQTSFELYGIKEEYQVAIRQCENSVIDLGFHQKDFIEKAQVPCGGRDLPKGCHFIEVTFLHKTDTANFWAKETGILLLVLGGLFGFLIFYRQKSKHPSDVHKEIEYLEFGNSKLDVSGQKLICNGSHQTMTFRETKLLNLFATNFNQLLQREFILQQVWADEGVLVGRSLDVFVSRLRKKLAEDKSVSIIVVHGIGYRLEEVQADS